MSGTVTMMPVRNVRRSHPMPVHHPWRASSQAAVKPASRSR